ncbi:MAG: recombinase [Campylobacterota bacterium]
MKNSFKTLLKTINNQQMHVIDKITSIISFIRPENSDDKECVLNDMDTIIKFFKKNKKIASWVSDEINQLFIESKISNNISNLSILSSYGFKHEIHERFYDKFLPKPPQKGDLEYIFSTIFYKKNDYVWVSNIDDEKWIEFFSSLFSDTKHTQKTKNHLFSELLYAAEILSIWIASFEFNNNFIRLDKTLLSSDSAFISLQRDISDLIHKIQEDNIDLYSTKLDFEHIEVLIHQCNKQVSKLKDKSVKYGISINLTYELERLTQIIERLEDVLELIKNFDTNKSYLAFVELFKESVKKIATKNSLYEVYQQSSRIVAKSITNNTGEHGEKYITNNTKEYILMFLSAAGAGVLIAIMALIKINIIQAEFSQGIETLLSSLNYGFGFVIIHLLGLTVATKQPAMTASTFAQAIEKEDKNRRKVNQKKLIGLIFQVSRSQFAAVLGNVTLALLVAFVIAYFIINNGSAVLNSQETAYYLKGLEPYSALFFASIAGIWLFCSGLIAGYYDNRADLLELNRRYYHHPLLKKALGNTKREKLANYLHEHHGAIAGNFFFGILLGITPFIGYLLDLPLDIRHVAFSTAYLGYASMHTEFLFNDFLFYLMCVLLIGLVNLTISFILALKVSLVSQETNFGNLFSFLKLLLIEILKRPHHFIFPFNYKNHKRK